MENLRKGMNEDLVLMEIFIYTEKKRRKFFLPQYCFFKKKN